MINKKRVICHDQHITELLFHLQNHKKSLALPMRKWPVSLRVWFYILSFQVAEDKQPDSPYRFNQQIWLTFGQLCHIIWKADPESFSLVGLHDEVVFPDTKKIGVQLWGRYGLVLFQFICSIKYANCHLYSACLPSKTPQETLEAISMALFATKDAIKLHS